MEIADVISCDFYAANSWDGREESKFHIYETGDQIGLDIETKRTGPDGQLQELIQLKVTKMDIEILHRFQSTIGGWLQHRSDQETLQTRPVEGVYEDSSEETEINRLDIELSTEGVRILGLASGNHPVTNAVHVPSATEVHNGGFDSCNHLKRLYSLIEVFLAGVDASDDDVLRSSNYLINSDEHIHSDLPPVCLDRLRNEDYTGVVQAAGTALEEALESRVPDELRRRTNNATDLATQAFGDSNPEFRWGYDKGEQQGLMFLYCGAFLALRNPTSHRRREPERSRYLDDITEQDAIDILCVFNFLLRRLDIYSEMELEHEDSKCNGD